jgi:poly(3-hydroxyalkanoate) synthetase
MNLKPKKKLLKKFIKNIYKENKLIRDILAILYKQEGRKTHY